MIQIGTSGYSYADWKGYFYPETLPSKQFLSYYSNHFDALELNFSYYKMPTATQIEAMVRQTDGKMTFAVKAHQCFTHQRTPATADFKQFNNALTPMTEADCLGAVLLQFPHSFHQNGSNRQYLKRLTEQFTLPLVAEFRHVDWAAPAITDWLRKLQIGYCCVDEPALDGLMPRAEIATSNIAYVRFHGRNKTKWYNHNHAYERYNYQYSKNELQEWVPAILKLAQDTDKTLVFFNNHFQAKAVDGARQLSQILSTL
ncbi:MAG: DUF72 domain-containing protein [Deltaproteobacteria bacterium]|nr:DUF72 domain-containing protein [Deltaproteobacteria bacterium]MBN2672005.1 DUF72 domain-containing protein [Deltaproteobacteria bacterium]